MWKTVKLGDICEILDKLRKPITKKNRMAGNVPYYGATGIVDWVKDFIFDEKLVLVGEDGAKWDSGESTAFIIEGKTWVNNHAHVLRPIDGLLTHEWLAYYLTSIDLSPWVTGLTVPKLNQAQLRSIPIPLPPLAEQQRIVAKLDAAFAEIDGAASSTESCINLANTFFTNKVLKVFSEVNEKSALKIIDDVCDSMHQGLNSQAEKIGFVDDGIVLLQTRNIRLGTIDKNKQLNFLPDYCWEKYSKKYAPKIGDVLFTNRGTIGKLAQILENFDSLIHWNIFKLSPNFNLVTSAFIYRTLDFLNKSNYFENMQTGTTVGFVSTKMMKNAPIFLPTIEEQEKICDELNALEILNKKYISSCEAKLTSLTQLKQSILAQELQSEAA